MIHIVTPGNAQATLGGVRKLWDWAKMLRELGHDVEMIETNTSVPAQPLIKPDDVILIPEMYGDWAKGLAPGVAKVAVAQNPFNVWGRQGWGNFANMREHAYLSNPDLLDVVVVSDHARDELQRVFPDLRIDLIRPAVDPEQGTDEARFFLGPFPRHKRICLFTRKLGDRAWIVLSILTTRHALDGWELLALDGMSDGEVAQAMRSSRFFLSFSELEGNPAPPREALACGCRVIGFHGFGGAEYFQHATTIPADDCFLFAQMTELLLEADGGAVDDPAFVDGAHYASQWILDRYGREQEHETLEQLADFWTSSAITFADTAAERELEQLAVQELDRESAQRTLEQMIAEDDARAAQAAEDRLIARETEELT